jgi:class 3 adenylate cyclase
MMSSSEPGGPGILVVDDNDDNRYTLQLLLEADGHERIVLASGGHEALACLHRETFDLVLLDIMMPDLNGHEVLKIIKGNPATRDIPVVILSADTDADMISRCIAAGADDYLPKPFNSAILRARIGSGLRRASLRAMEREYLLKIEQEKSNSERLLRNVLPAEIAARLRSGETNIADQIDEATIICADVVGFGKITARMHAYEVVGCLNRLFSEFDRVADVAAVEKIRTLGDSYMAAAGVPTPQPNHARIGVGFALDMATAADRLSASLPVPFPMRIGVHSGPVMAGVIGTRRFVYDVWGDTVTIAARLEAASAANRVLVSASTAELLGDEFVLEGPRAVDNKEQRLLHAYFVSRR